MSGSEFKQASDLSSLLAVLKLETLAKGKRLTSQDQLAELEHNLLTGLSLVSALRNAARPINTLPSSVLSHVFRLLQEEDEDLPPNRWILITHVCRHWRSVANETPSLWNRIHVHSNPRQVQYFLDQSLSLPLTVICGSPVLKAERSETLSMLASITRALRAISVHMDRVQELYFFKSFPVDAVLQRDQFCRVVLPRISSRLHSGSQTQTLNGHPVDIFEKFFSVPSPSMRKLSLHGLPISYMLDSSIRFDSLTHLALYEQPNWPRDEPNFSSNLDAFLDILQATSESLQSLTLIRAGPEGDISQETTKSDVAKRRTVALPALTSLEIGDWINSGNIAYFLAHLVVPGTAKRCIWGDNFKYLSSILFPLDPETAKTKRRGWDSEIKRLVFTAIKGTDMIGIHDNAVYIQGDLDFLTIYPLFRDQPQIFDCVEEVVFSTTSSRAALTGEEYRLLFDTLPNVQRLLMVDMDISRILQAMGLFSQDTNSTSEPALSELREIDIQYSTMPGRLVDKSPACDPLGNEYKTSSLSAFMGLAKLCQRRHKLGYSVEKVKFNFGSRRIVGDVRGDYTEMVDFLRRWVEDLELVDDLDGLCAVDVGTNFVSELLEGMWPSGALLGNF
ncbi:hypothetical protein GALMADRAFT_229724 [Galerina marginata CBS 339.88]|uniref:F-box domain-containing protein n=1 Tax=Galerina marginata (strain CBS 339.88) TaxID=685588 RepID=A0A067STQ8_GALM3|nr:hypothetical protein GALMADRAFT_229724 [Galerina marginata CBS 339.88]